MVLLSASICTKNGRVVVARQFMEVSRSRIEGLLAAFPKLIKEEEQHTFVETESVRYVYQPLDSLFLVLITTKNSNILEDLETLRLFARVVPEYCRTFTEAEVTENAFELIFAFDEVIALGYRENVNLSKIRLYTLMESHEEQLQLMIRRNKEAAARAEGLRREKELKKLKHMEALGAKFSGGSNRGGFGSDSRGQSMGGGGGGYSSGGGSGGGGGGGYSSSSSSMSAARPSSTSSKPSKPKRSGMKLGGKAKTNDFVEALIKEGETVTDVSSDPGTSAHGGPGSSHSLAVPDIDRESVHVRIDEKLNVIVTRDGALEEMSVKGAMQLNVSEPPCARIRLQAELDESRSLSFQTHPNVNKKAWQESHELALKNPGRPFPINTDVGVLKWRYQTNDESEVPLTITCWPNPNSDGSCDVNVDYELVDTSLSLQELCIAIPLPAGRGQPIISTVDGDYDINSRDSLLLWNIPLANQDNTEGSLEFSIDSTTADDFFPVIVSFHSSQSYAGLQIVDVQGLESEEAVPFSSEVAFTAGQFEIV